MLKPAINTTEEPPTTVHDPLLLAYINELRRRIEIQNIQMTELATLIQTLRTDNQHLNQSLKFYQEQQLQEMP
jgi:cell shape-determining protein MreC